MLSHPVRLFVVLLVLAGCGDSRCALKPEPGVCEALIPKAFFNSTTNRCEPFDWGGCGGVVPFRTVEECRQVCGG